MRKIIISICFLFAINIVVGQEAVQIIDEIAIIIKAKNEQELSRHLAPHVEITLNDVPKEIEQMMQAFILLIVVVFYEVIRRFIVKQQIKDASKRTDE